MHGLRPLSDDPVQPESSHHVTCQENRDRELEYGDSLQQAMDQLEQAALSLR